MSNISEPFNKKLSIRTMLNRNIEVLESKELGSRERFIAFGNYQHLAMQSSIHHAIYLIWKFSISTNYYVRHEMFLFLNGSRLEFK